ncbi:hypothetical protein Tco_1110524 [Tanacetum coccineum]|uniref:Uncharacterized protein n=1 Tax=Tanacetum coccineum TaxID=301880 RepID=A0ABQ5IK96_9ASTR
MPATPSPTTAITDQITRALPSDTVKYPKLTINFTALVFSARSYPTEDPECSTRIHSSINVITICPKQPDISRNNNPRGEEQEENDNPENINTNPSSLPDPSVSFVTEKVHKLNSFLESFSLVPQSPDTKFVSIKKDDEDVMFIEIIKKYVDSHEEELEEDENMMIREMGVEYFDIFLTRTTSIHNTYEWPDSTLFFKKPNHYHNGAEEIAYKMPQDREQYNSLSDLKKEHTKSVYFRKAEDKRRRVDYVMSKILGFYKECLELGPEYLTVLEEEGGVT